MWKETQRIHCLDKWNGKEGKKYFPIPENGPHPRKGKKPPWCAWSVQPARSPPYRPRFRLLLLLFLSV